MKSEIEILLYKRGQLEKEFNKKQQELEQLQKKMSDIDFEIEKLNQIKDKYNLKSI